MEVTQNSIIEKWLQKEEQGEQVYKITNRDVTHKF